MVTDSANRALDAENMDAVLVAVHGVLEGLPQRVSWSEEHKRCKPVSNLSQTKCKHIFGVKT